MKSYTCSEARQNFASILEEASRDGMVRIERRDGQRFVLIPEPIRDSPLDVPGVTLSTSITRDDILHSIEDSRRRYDGD